MHFLSGEPMHYLSGVDIGETNLLKHPTLDQLHTLGLHGMAKAFAEIAAGVLAGARDGNADCVESCSDGHATGYNASAEAPQTSGAL